MTSWLQRNRDLVALACGGFCLLLLEFGLRVPPVTAFGVALAVWLSIWLSLAPKRVSRSEPKVEAAFDEGPSAADMQEARKTLSDLEALRPALAVHGAQFCKIVDSILQNAQAMLRDAETHPEGFRYDRRALLHYLPQILGLLQQSIEPGVAYDEPAQARLLATCKHLEDLFASFRRRKVERQTRALNVQIDVLEAQLRQEGFVPPPADKPIRDR